MEPSSPVYEVCEKENKKENKRQINYYQMRSGECQGMRTMWFAAISPDPILILPLFYLEERKGACDIYFLKMEWK